MGAATNKRMEDRDARKARQNEPTKRVKRDDTRGADWGEANPALIAHCVIVVAQQGGALRFGYSRDGGAFSVGVYGDGDAPYTEYIRPSEDIDAYLRALASQWGDGE